MKYTAPCFLYNSEKWPQGDGFPVHIHTSSSTTISHKYLLFCMPYVVISYHQIWKRTSLTQLTIKHL